MVPSSQRCSVASGWLIFRLPCASAQRFCGQLPLLTRALGVPSTVYLMWQFRAVLTRAVLTRALGMPCSRVRLPSIRMARSCFMDRVGVVRQGPVALPSQGHDVFQGRVLVDGGAAV